MNTIFQSHFSCFSNFFLRNKLFCGFCVAVTFSICFSSCKKFIAVDPPQNSLTSATVFSDDLTATAAMSYIYTNLSSGSGNLSSITYLGGILADEATCYSTNANTLQFFTNNLQSVNPSVTTFWGSQGYSIIYNANAILEGLSKSTTVSAPVKTQLEGEAKFIRAFIHLYLVSLFGDIPYITTTDYQANTIASRLPKAQVLQKIIDDLTDAKSKLASDYSYSNGERVKPNKWAASALLARAYLYNNNWAAAENEATQVINNTSDFGLTSLNSVFLKNSTETIWQLQSISSTVNTNEGNIFILTTTPRNSALRPEFMNAFEAGDNRKSSWTGSVTVNSSTYYFPYKYKIRTGNNPLNEYSMVLRLGETYLIRAEARAQLNNVPGSQADLNMIRNRAGLGNTPASDKASLLLAIENERRVELFSEWGHRWIDLNRTGRIDAVLGVIKPGWQSHDALFPLPQSDILVNPNLVQNPGY